VERSLLREKPTRQFAGSVSKTQALVGFEVAQRKDIEKRSTQTYVTRPWAAAIAISIADRC